MNQVDKKMSEIERVEKEQDKAQVEDSKEDEDDDFNSPMNADRKANPQKRESTLPERRREESNDNSDEEDDDELELDLINQVQLRNSALKEKEKENKPLKLYMEEDSNDKLKEDSYHIVAENKTPVGHQYYENNYWRSPDALNSELEDILKDYE